MKWISPILVLVAALAAGCTPQQSPEQQVLESAAQALGGVDAVRAAQTLAIEGTGSAWWLGQAPRPDTERELPVSAFMRQYDLTNRRMRTVATTPLYGQQVTTTLAVDGAVAFDLDPQGAPRRINEAPGAGRQPGFETPLTLTNEALKQEVGFYHHPLTLLRAALAQGEGAAQVSALRVDGGDSVLEMTTPAGPLTLRVNRQTHVPVSISSRGYISTLGDVVVLTSFGDYAEVDGLRLPQRITQGIDEHPATDLKVRNSVGVDVGDLAAPAAIAAAEEPQLPPAVVIAEKLAPGVWRLEGNANHRSMLVELPTYTVLVEAPVSDRRALAVIAKARELAPGKPLRYLVNTHHHFDHSGGVRAAVAEGLTLITHEINRDFFQQLVARPHTIFADHLAKHPAPLSMETVKSDGMLTLRDQGRVIEVYPITGDTHDQGMLMAYLPADGILSQADVFASDWVGGGESNLLRNIRERGLRVQRIVSVHGDVVPFSALEKAAVSPPSAPE